jgi:hypothetical protein
MTGVSDAEFDAPWNAAEPRHCLRRTLFLTAPCELTLKQEANAGA